MEMMNIEHQEALLGKERRARFEKALIKAETEFKAAIKKKYGEMGEFIFEKYRPSIKEGLLEDNRYDGDPDGSQGVIDGLVFEFGYVMEKGLELFQIMGFLPLVNLEGIEDMSKFIQENIELKKPQKVRGKAVDRAVRILEFCFDYIVDLKPGEKPNWEQIANDWNQKYPYGKMSTNALKTAFSRAKNDKRAILVWATSIGMDYTKRRSYQSYRKYRAIMEPIYEPMLQELLAQVHKDDKPEEPSIDVDESLEEHLNSEQTEKIKAIHESQGLEAGKEYLKSIVPKARELTEEEKQLKDTQSIEEMRASFEFDRMLDRLSEEQIEQIKTIFKSQGREATLEYIKSITEKGDKANE